MPDPTPTTVSAWIQLFRTHKRLRNSVDRALKAALLPPLEWYDVLLELERAGVDGLRPYELEQNILLPQHGVSRLVDKMAQQNLVSRKPSKKDGRGYHLSITQDGLKLRQKIWKTYGPQIEKGIAAHLTQAEVKTLARLLTKIT